MNMVLLTVVISEINRQVAKPSMHKQQRTDDPSIIVIDSCYKT